MTARRLAVSYAVALAFAQVLAAVEVTALVLPLRSATVAGVDTVFSARTVFTAVVLLCLSLAAVTCHALLTVYRTLAWYTAGEKPTKHQRRSTRRITRNQSAVLFGCWLVGALVLIAVNRQGGVSAAIFLAMAAAFGATTSAGAALLMTMRLMRPAVAKATTYREGRDTSPGILARLLLMWLLSCALPTVGIGALVIMRSHGWIIEQTGSIEIPVVVLSVVSLLVGLRGMTIASLSISDPVGDVVHAMSEVEHGRIDARVEVYERSEIGRLQRGFNSMVAGLAERDRLRDLFGRHVGADVARRAVTETGALTGEVREAAVLFVDLVGSTRLAQARSPEEVAGVLNRFFRDVVTAVDARGGLINKFQGDAVLAVFGVPLPNPAAASDALATARALGVSLRRLPLVDFGIGVSAGPVFAGNIGAETRYEYTVIGDPVNEAARLADRAKETPGRVLCAEPALALADDGERSRWTAGTCEVLRGRSAPTAMSTPVVSA